MSAHDTLTPEEIFELILDNDPFEQILVDKDADPRLRAYPLARAVMQATRVKISIAVCDALNGGKSTG